MTAGMLRDLRFALRQLTRTPGFTAVAVITLAVAIGVNSAIFSIINGLVLRPMVPLRPAEVVNVFTAWKDAPRDYRPFSYQEYLALRDSDDVFADVAVVQHVLVGVGPDQERRRSFASLTSENFFSLMGVRPALGRFFDQAEARPNAGVRVAVASDAMWRRLGGRRDLVGSTVRVNGQPFTVIGVAPAGFSGVHAVFAPELWLPLGVQAQLGLEGRNGSSASRQYSLSLVARLRAGLTLAGARGRLDALAGRLTALQPPETGTRARQLQLQAPSRFSISSTPADEAPVTLIGTLLMAMALVVLLIASLNLANMLLARGTARRKEIAVRLALGASRGRIVRQLLCEGLLLAVAGGAAGLLLSAWSNDLLVHALGALYPSISFSMVVTLAPDALVLAVTVALCLAATLVFSLGPALDSSRADLVADLKQETGDPTGARRLHRFFAPRHLLVMAQLALSLALLFAAGLFVRGALQAARVQLGFRPAGVLVAEMDFTLGRNDPAAARRSMLAALDRTRALPAVSGAALGTLLPYGGDTVTRRLTRAGEPPGPGRPDGPRPVYTAITAGYFAALGVPLLRGRDFTAQEQDPDGTPAVAIIDQALADDLFPGGGAVGSRIRYAAPPSDGSPGDLEVVGVVASHRHDVFGASRPRLFVPLTRAPGGSVFLYLRLGSDRRSVLAAEPRVRQALREVQPDLPVLSLTPFLDLVEQNVGLWIIRLGAVLFGILAAIALLLAAVGAYGVKAYAIARRTHEIGIRMALGADAGNVFVLVMKQAALQTLLALAVGTVLALAAGRVLSRLLYQVSPTDPLALGLAAAVLAAATLLACYLPARRATRVTPMSALRTQ
jgi:putative ABC transport system permease protein